METRQKARWTVGALAVFLAACAVWRPQLLAVLGQSLLDVAAPPLWGGLLALLLGVPYRWLLRRWGAGSWGRAGALVVCYAAFLGALVGMAALLAPQLAQSLLALGAQGGDHAATLQALLAALRRRLPLPEIPSNVWQQLFDGVAALLRRLFPHLLGLTADLLRTLLQMVLGLFFSVYLLTDGPLLARQAATALRTWLPGPQVHALLRLAALCKRMVQGWLFGQLLDCLILGVSCGAGMALLGFPLPALVGLVTGVCNLVPVVGGLLGGAVSFLLLFAVRPLQAVWFVVYYLLLQQLEGRFLYPRIVGSRLGLPPLLVLFSVLCGGELGGFLGILLALPAAAVLYAAARSATRDRHRRQRADAQKYRKTGNGEPL